MTPAPFSLRSLLLASIWLCAATLSASAKLAAPDWVTAVSNKPASFNYGMANSAVLLDEAVLDIDRGGTYITRTRFVEKILTRDGKSNAVAAVPYDSSACKVRSVQAWLIRPSGEVVLYGKKKIIDIATYASALELYGEERTILISAADDAEAGAVFAYEAVVEKKSIFTHFDWYFQTTRPSEISRFTVNLPSGWTCSERTFNHEAVVPSALGNSRTWSLVQLAAAESEPMGPSSQNSRPWLALQLHPPPHLTAAKQEFTGWGQISQYLSPKYELAATPTPEVAAKATALTAASSSPWEAIRRLCRFAQNTNYISINMNVSQAGGYIPRPAGRVLQCNYGDCKDKATLLCSLLKARKVRSFPLLVSSGSGKDVRSDWPSPVQFNHCILAIEVDDSVRLPAVIVHPKLGRFLLFDPTNPYVPPGWLPDHDSEGHGLLLADADGGLIPMPSTSAAENSLTREITARLYGDGGIQGVVSERFAGQPAADAREEFRDDSPADYKKRIERWLGRSMPSARGLKIEPEDEFDNARFALKSEFSCASYGKQMRDVLLIFKPILVARRESTALKKGKRLTPVLVSPFAFSEVSVISLPEGFVVDELPRSADLNTPFGAYTVRFTHTGNQLKVERSLRLESATIEPDGYESVRSFYEKLLQTEQSPVVLRRQ